MGDLNTRVALLEQLSEHHEQEIKRLDDSNQQLNKTLAGIQAQLSQIKWIAMGVGLTVLAENLGFVAVLKSMVL